MKKKHRQEHKKSFIMFHLDLLLGILIMIRDQIQRVLNEWALFREELKSKMSDMMSQITALIISNTDIREELKTQSEKTKTLEESLRNENGEVCRKRARLDEDTDEFVKLKREVRCLSQALSDMQDSLRQYQGQLESHSQVVGLSSLNLNDFEHDIRQLERTNYEGILVWRIIDFAQRRREAINGIKASFYSHCFYSSRYGYKMCARIYLNGDGIGKGTHISLFFVLMRGDYDALLRWPFRQKVTLMILDQNQQEHVVDAFMPDPNSSSFQRPRQEMNVASGCPKFFPLSELTEHAFVKDDCMFIKMIIDKPD